MKLGYTKVFYSRYEGCWIARVLIKKQGVLFCWKEFADRDEWSAYHRARRWLKIHQNEVFG